MRGFLVRRTLDQWIIVDARDETHAIEVASGIADDQWETSDECYEPEEHVRSAVGGTDPALREKRP